MSTILQHKHLIVTARVLNPPKDVKYIKTWTKKLIKTINMEVLLGPYAIYSDMVGNRGLTVATIINTSHLILHSWDETEPGLIQLDLYSCADFSVSDVFDAIQEFGPVEIDYFFIDRDNKLKLLETKRPSFWSKLKDYVNRG